MDRMLVRGKLLIEGTGSPPIEGGAILLEGERILAAGREQAMDTGGVVQRSIVATRRCSRG